MTAMSPIDLGQQSLPHNYPAEQQLLGSLMLRNELVDRIGFLAPEHFADPVHGRVFEAIRDVVASGHKANPVTLRARFSADEQWAELGGDAYMASLCGAAAAPGLTEDYGREILDCALRRDLILLGEEIAESGYASPGADGQIAAAASRLDQLGRSVGHDGLRGVGDYRKAVQELYAGKVKRPISTGFSNLDEFYRIRPGELSVVTGYPSSGKSQFVDAVMVNLATRENWKFAVCSFENQPDEHIAKLAELYLGKPFHDGPTWRMGSSDLDSAMAWIDEHFVFIRAEKDAPTVEWALGRARMAVERFGVNGVVFDPYNEFEHRRPREMSETEYVSQCLGRVTRFAKNHQVHFWFVAHPQKPPPGTRDEAPGLMSISGSANWSNKADCGVVVHRPFLPNGERDRIAEIHVKKVRFRAVGRPGMAKLEFMPATGRYVPCGGGR